MKLGKLLMGFCYCIKLRKFLSLSLDKVFTIAVPTLYAAFVFVMVILETFSSVKYLITVLHILL